MQRLRIDRALGLLFQFLLLYIEATIGRGIQSGLLHPLKLPLALPLGLSLINRQKDVFLVLRNSLFDRLDRHELEIITDFAGVGNDSVAQLERVWEVSLRGTAVESSSLFERSELPHRSPVESGAEGLVEKGFLEWVNDQRGNLGKSVIVFIGGLYHNALGLLEHVHSPIYDLMVHSHLPYARQFT